MTHGCGATGRNIINFRNWDCHDKIFPHVDMLLPQTPRCGVGRTRPIELAESPHAILFAIWPTVVALQPQTLSIFGIQIPNMKEFPTLICSQYRQPGAVDSALDLLNYLNLLVPFFLPYDSQLWCYRCKHHQFSEFGIPWYENSPLRYAPTMLSCAQSWRNRPIRCSESSGAIHFMMQPLAVGLQTQTSPIFGIQNPEMKEFPTLICPHYSQPGPAGSVRHLFHVLNPPVPFILWLDYWLLRYSNKHHQFSEFEMQRWKNYRHWYAPTTDSQVQWIAYRTYWMRWISSCHPFCHMTHSSSATGPNIHNFRNLKCCTRATHTCHMPPLQPDSPWESRPRPIPCADSRRAIRFVIWYMAEVRQWEMSPIFTFSKSTTR